jgi:hypothetical protein
VYSFRYDDWSPCTVIGYDRIRKLHYCHYHATGEKQWHSLKGKKVEVVPPERGHASTGGSDGRGPGSRSSSPAIELEQSARYEEDNDYDDDWEPADQTEEAAGGKHIHVKRVVGSSAFPAVRAAAE